MNLSSVTSEVGRSAPIPFFAYGVYLLETHGAFLLLLLGILFAGAQFYWRRKEHKARMRYYNRGDHEPSD